MITETIYLKRDNPVCVKLLANGVAQNITGTNRMTLKIGETTIDSNIHSNVFDWDTNGADGQLNLTLGHQTIRPGTYVARLVVYDTTYTRGIEWDSGLVVKVKDGAP